MCLPNLEARRTLPQGSSFFCEAFCSKGGFPFHEAYPTLMFGFPSWLPTLLKALNSSQRLILCSCKTSSSSVKLPLFCEAIYLLFYEASHSSVYPMLLLDFPSS